MKNVLSQKGMNKFIIERIDMKGFVHRNSI